MADQSGPNAAYVAQLFADYLDAPASVPDEWRTIFDGAGGHEGNGHTAETSPAAAAPVATAAPEAPAAAPPPAAPAEVDAELLGGVAAAMALVKAYRMHGHLAARLDPLGSEPMGDPALDETRLHPPLTPELQARIPALLRGGGRVETTRLDCLAEPYTLGVIGDVLDLVGDRAGVGLAQLGQRVGEGVARHSSRPRWG